MIGHIKIDRKIQKWEWYQDSKMVHLFIHLLLNASYKDSKFRGIPIKRGQLITGRLKLSADVGLSERAVRTCLNHLKKTKEITIQSTSKYSIITICKYDIYQSFDNNYDQQFDQQTTNNSTKYRPSTDQQVTTSNNTNNINNKEIERKEGVAPHPPPDSVVGYKHLPDGRSYIDREVFFTQEDFNGLPEDKNKSTLDLIKITKKAELTSDEVDGLWGAFKNLNLTFQKPYRNKDDVYNHFANWACGRTFRKLTPQKTEAKKNKDDKPENKGLNLKNVADRYD